uniref:Uncharacterized protein n=1 Tax=Arundo donax TaxID=35708 RepID=A0A0A8YVJ0_ARUDO
MTPVASTVQNGIILHASLPHHTQYFLWRISRGLILLSAESRPREVAGVGGETQERWRYG